MGPLALVVHPALEMESEPPAEQELDEDYRRLLTELGFGPTAVDALVERTGLTAEVVSSMLLILELKGQVASTPGGLYTRVTDEVPS
jgi:DNA processing protein